MINKDLAKIFREMAELHDINGEKIVQRINAYKKAAAYLDSLQTDISKIYKEKGFEGLKVKGVIGDKNAEKIEEYIKKGKIKDFENLRQETAIKQVITFYFETKGLSLQELKENAKKRKIIYSRFTKPSKQLLELAGSVEKAKEAMKKVAEWAKSRNLDYAIETVFKKWLEIGDLKPKEVVKKPFFHGLPMVRSESKKRWYVIDKFGEWLEFAGKESEIEWKEIKK
jgi:hypothetical protein